MVVAELGVSELKKTRVLSWVKPVRSTAKADWAVLTSSNTIARSSNAIEVPILSNLIDTIIDSREATLETFWETGVFIIAKVDTCRSKWVYATSKDLDLLAAEILENCQ